MEVPQIDVHALAATAADGCVLDVRTAEEYAEAHHPDAVLIPLAELTERVDEVPDTAGGPLFVICAVGGRSERAAAWLRGQGIDAVNVAGGTQAWIAAGYDVVRGPGPA